MSNIFIAVLNMSLTASYVALVVIFVRLLLMKAPKIFSYVLWGVVLFRLLFPFSISSPLSFINGEINYIPQDIAYSETPSINTGFEIVDNPVNKYIQASFSPNPTESVNPMGVLIEVGTLVWLLGISTFLLYNLISYLKFKHQLSFATLVRDNIYETDLIQGSFVLGFIKPRIYIPTGLAGKELDYILKHEDIHIKRRDYLIKPVALLAVTLHWFNPIIWICYFLMIKDMEMSCDESVIKQTSEDIRTCYSKSLLILSAKQSGLLSPLAFGESNIKSRVKNILNYKSPKFWIVIACILLLVIVSTALLTNSSGRVVRDVGVTVNSNKFLIDSKQIDKMTIGVVARDGEIVFGEAVDAGEVYNVDVDNKEQVEMVVALLKDIRVEELSQEKIQEIFENNEVFDEKINYRITLTTSKETGKESLKGIVYLLEERKLIFVDPKTIVDSWENAQETEKIFLYISVEQQADVINRLVEIIEDVKHEFLN